MAVYPELLQASAKGGPEWQPGDKVDIAVLLLMEHNLIFGEKEM